MNLVPRCSYAGNTNDKTNTAIRFQVWVFDLTNFKYFNDRCVSSKHADSSPSSLPFLLTRWCLLRFFLIPSKVPQYSLQFPTVNRVTVIAHVLEQSVASTKESPLRTNPPYRQLMRRAPLFTVHTASGCSFTPCQYQTLPIECGQSENQRPSLAILKVPIPCARRQNGTGCLGRSSCR